MVEASESIDVEGVPRVQRVTILCPTETDALDVLIVTYCPGLAAGVMFVGQIERVKKRQEVVATPFIWGSFGVDHGNPTIHPTDKAATDWLSHLAEEAQQAAMARDFGGAIPDA